MTGYLICIGHCVACGTLVTFNPTFVPSINGKPVCRECVEKWKKIHGENFRIHPLAYEPKEEM